MFGMSLGTWLIFVGSALAVIGALISSAEQARESRKVADLQEDIRRRITGEDLFPKYAFGITSSELPRSNRIGIRLDIIGDSALLDAKAVISINKKGSKEAVKVVSNEQLRELLNQGLMSVPLRSPLVPGFSHLCGVYDIDPKIKPQRIVVNTSCRSGYFTQTSEVDYLNKKWTAISTIIRKTLFDGTSVVVYDSSKDPDPLAGKPVKTT